MLYITSNSEYKLGISNHLIPDTEIDHLLNQSNNTTLSSYFTCQKPSFYIYSTAPKSSKIISKWLVFITSKVGEPEPIKMYVQIIPIYRRKKMKKVIFCSAHGGFPLSQSSMTSMSLRFLSSFVARIEIPNNGWQTEFAEKK